MSNQAARLYLDDLVAGQVFYSDDYVLDEVRLKDFAREFDPQPFHLDHEAALPTLFGGLAASGWHTAAITMRLMVQSVPIAGGMIGAGVEVSWPQPTRPDDRLRLESRILEVAPSNSKPDRGWIRLESLTFNHKNELVQRLVSRILVFKRPND